MASVLVFGAITSAQSESQSVQTFTHIKFRDLDQPTKTRWDNQLEITPEFIVFTPHGARRPVRIPKSQVRELRYGWAATFLGNPPKWNPEHEPDKYIEAALAAPFWVPVAIGHAVHHPFNHHIGIVYASPCAPKRTVGVSFEADNKTYRDILRALQAGSAAPLLVREKDAQRVPPGLTTRFTTLYDAGMPGSWPKELTAAR
jgi:hypothetical protein